MVYSRRSYRKSFKRYSKRRSYRTRRSYKTKVVYRYKRIYKKDYRSIRRLRNSVAKYREMLGLLTEGLENRDASDSPMDSGMQPKTGAQLAAESSLGMGMIDDNGAKRARMGVDDDEL